MELKAQVNKSRKPKGFRASKNFIKRQAVMASPCWGTAECDSNLILLRASRVCLKLEDLKCFEVVENQFRPYGITLKNAVAIEPSNPAFPALSGTKVLMAAPRNGWMEAIFSRPISALYCYVTSSYPTVLSAYDENNKLLVTASTGSSNLATSDSTIPPNILLGIEKANISRIYFYAFDGQVTIADLCFEFEETRAYG
ncbi:MAG: hypothetical protein F6K31_06470 [Symploca sp. SIO2G7]|nr:hypothetical protein [Symploca sp. SIO2G7]